MPPSYSHAIRVMTVYSNEAIASPKAVPQGDKHRWKFVLDLVAFLPYPIKEQATLIL